MPDNTGDVWKENWAVSVAGRNMTSAMNPYLQPIEVIDKVGSSSDTVRLIFDDTEA